MSLTCLPEIYLSGISIDILSICIVSETLQRSAIDGTPSGSHRQFRCVVGILFRPPTPRLRSFFTLDDGGEENDGRASCHGGKKGARDVSVSEREREMPDLVP